MQTDDGILADEQIEAINKKHGDIIDMVMGFQHGRTTAGQLMDKIAERCDAFAQATLSALAKVTDEELTRQVAELMYGGKLPKLDDYPEAETTTGDFIGEAKKIVDFILPILSARHQKELQEAVERERQRMKQLTWCAYCGKEYPLDTVTAEQIGEHIATCEKHPLYQARQQLKLADKNYLDLKNEFDARVEQALIEERKAIGEYLEIQNWNPNYHGAWIIPRPTMKRLVQMLKKGERPALKSEQPGEVRIKEG